MTIEDLKSIIETEKQKRDFMHELTPANAALFRKMAGSTFEAVMIGKGDEKSSQNRKIRTYGEINIMQINY